MALPSSLLCPIDFSPGSERALRHALALTAAFGAHLTIVTVNDPTLVELAEAAGHADTLRDQVEAALLQTLERLPAAASPLLPAIEIVTGAPADEILATAERAGAQLIVMGTRGLGNAGRFMFGSTTEKVVRAAHVPVLAVPDDSPDRMTIEDGAPRFGFAQVIAAVGLDPADTTVVESAAAWASACGARLVVSHIEQDAPAPAWWPFATDAPPAAWATRARAALDALVRAVPGAASAEVDVRRGAVAPQIAALVRERDAGLLVISRGGGQHRLGATAYRAMVDAAVPTLVVAGA